MRSLHTAAAAETKRAPRYAKTPPRIGREGGPQDGVEAAGGRPDPQTTPSRRPSSTACWKTANTKWVAPNA
eukprot:2069644-Alexandrium_andersonii.AAC.1